ncbi:isoleucine--tRNA ligase [Salinarchaeum laminariae]|uniref:isoleucine--tRNA ligase n=1 Tax=Salinarchaeum laminariae TaxID=869888 RepID=UPI0020C068D4|nr:isoleucine--tRNA ligase [Salinarchaeum laminariae]
MSDSEDVSDQYDPHAVEDHVEDRWEERNAYEKTVEHRADGEDFFFVDGPPYTSGAAHMGTTWNKTLKDAYIRYHRMCGYDVTDRPGYDMHGLPIETKVEEQLGFENKKDIENFGEEAFIEECKEFAEEQLEGLQSDFQSFGVWMDWENPYKTVDPEYMEAAWWGFDQAHERGLVEQGKRSISQCPRCETAIANNEVEYEQVEDPSIYVKFDLRDRDGKLVIWTTTPWTIPANTFVAVDPEVEYAAVDAEKDGDTERLYVAADCVEDVLTEGRYTDYEIAETMPGEALLGWEYDHPLAEEVPDHADGEGALQVYAADYVEVDRTGLVHSAPGHGEEDFERGQELGLDVFCPVGGDGVYDSVAGEYAGEFVKDADADVVADLEEKGLLLAHGTTTHSYGHCWRCDTGILQIVTDQWFITITDIKDELLANIEDSEWHPQWARDNRFQDFVEEAPDWNVSRQRYWGIPIPIWLPDGGDDWSGSMDDAIVICDREELAERVDQEIDPDAVDLHKGTVDDLTITEDGTTYERVPDVFDVWLDSSVASWGTIGYPSRTDEFDELWPADLIMEAHDQTRGWFWSQLGMGTAATGEIPYEEVLMHGYANMPDGRGMSKSKGITVEPGEVIDQHGADPMRSFLLSVNPQGEDMRFSWEGTETMQRDLNILWNVFRFPLPYMELDGFDPATADPERLASLDDDGALTTVDRWLLARLQSVAIEANDHWDEFRQDRALEAVRSFVVDDLSRFYVQVVRERMWEDGDSPEKLAAYETLTYALHRVVALLAPFAPYLTDEIYEQLTAGRAGDADGGSASDAGHPTVHMLDYPEPEQRWVDEQLEADLAVLREVEEAGSNARQQAERKLRWPVSRVVVAPGDATVRDAVSRHRELLADRLNSREIELLDPDADWGELTYSADADMGELGPAFGDRAHEVMTALNESSVDEPTVEAFAAALSEDGVLDDPDELTDAMVEPVTESPDDVSGTPIVDEGEELGVVYVDTTLDDDIESEGYAREVIRRVQEMRKELELDMEEPIRLEYSIADDRVAGLVAEHDDLIAEEVRADAVGSVDDGHRQTWDVEGTEIEIAIVSLATETAE